MEPTLKAAAAWRWWWGEIQPLIPAQWRTHRRRIIVELSDPGGPLRRVDGRPFASEAGDEVTLILPAAAVLRRRVSLPAPNERQLRNVVAFERERHSPIDPALLCSDHVVIARDKKARRFEVELRMVRRETIEKALESCRSAGMLPDRLLFAGDDVPADPKAFQLGTRRRAAGRRGRLLAAAQIGVPLLMLLLAIIAGQVRDARDRASLESLVAAQRQESAAADSLRRQVEDLRRQTQTLMREKQAPTVSKVLAEATRLLPDGSWLFQFEVSGREVRIAGYSPAASSLIALFDESGMFADARFRAPLTPGPRSDLERFEISFQVKGAKP